MVNFAKLLLISGTATIANCIKFEGPAVGDDYMQSMLELANRKDTANNHFKALNVAPSEKSYIGQELDMQDGAGVDSKIGVDLKDEIRLRVNLDSQDDALYVGTVYLGAPHSMPARVIFDTGSEHLAVTGSLCNDKSAGEYHVYNDNDFSKSLMMEIREKKEEKKPEKTKEQAEKEEQEAQAMTELVQTEINLDGKLHIVNKDDDDDDVSQNLETDAEVNKHPHQEGVKKENRCHSQAYNMHQSTAGKIQKMESMTLSYGSAKLQGFFWKDYTCLQPMDLKGEENAKLTNSTFIAQVQDSNSPTYTQTAEKQFLQESKVFQNENKCSFFQFMTLYKGHGIGKEADGILGLAPQKSVTTQQNNYVWSLFKNGIIQKPIMSFSMAASDMGDQSYALFGGYNSSQIVQGEKGIASFKSQPNNYKSSIRSWALDTKDILYAGNSLHYQGSTKTYPAVIDTGSSFIAVPPEEYKALEDKWRSTMGDLDCKTDATFCQVGRSCTEVAGSIESVMFNIENTVFEMKPLSYLHQGDGICQFAIAQNPLDKHNSGNYLFGGLFLKHFYSIYDYDQELISLGINTHSEGLVDMYPADKMKVSDGKAKAPVAAKDGEKKEETPKVNEKKPEEAAPKKTEKKSEETPKVNAAEKKPDASSESSDAFAAAASTEKLAGNAPVEGIPQVAANGETTIDSSAKKETESHAKITEKKENGEIAKTEVMPEAPKKDKKERKEEIAKQATENAHSNAQVEDDETKSSTDQWANANVESKEFKSKNGDLSEEEAKKSQEKAKPVETKKAETPKKTEDKPTEAKPADKKPAATEAKKEKPKPTPAPVKVEKKEDDEEKKPEAPIAVVELTDEQKQQKYLEDQVKKNSPDVKSESVIPTASVKVQVQTLDPFASSFKADDAVNYDQKHPEEKLEKENEIKAKTDVKLSTIAYEFDNNGKPTGEKEKETPVSKSDIDKEEEKIHEMESQIKSQEKKLGIVEKKAPIELKAGETELQKQMRENHTPEDDKEAAEQVKDVAKKETYSVKKETVPDFQNLELQQTNDDPAIANFVQRLNSAVKPQRLQTIKNKVQMSISSL